jgi:hypothetical protein
VGRRDKSSPWLDCELKGDEAMCFCGGGKVDSEIPRSFACRFAVGGALHRNLGLCIVWLGIVGIRQLQHSHQGLKITSETR